MTTSLERPLRILHLEDEPAFCDLVKDFLANEGLATEVSVVQNLEQLETALEQGVFDVILADYNLPTCTGLDALKLAARFCRRVPLILLSGAIDDAAGIRAVGSGASDYVPKSEIERLAPALRRLIGPSQGCTGQNRSSAGIGLKNRSLQALTENSLDAVAVISSEGLIQYVSPSAKQVLSYEASELVGRQVFDFVHVDDRSAAHDALHNAIENPNSRVSIEVRFLRRDQTWCYLEVFGQSHLDNPEVAGVVLNSRDITDRKRTQHRLDLLSAALEAAHNAIIITDTSGIIAWANPAFSRLSGYSLPEVQGKNPRFLKSDCQDRDFYEQLWNTIRSGEVWHSEMINRHKDGHLYTEECTITPVRDAQGEIKHFIAVKQDISERKRVAEQLQETHHRLLELSRQAAIAEFATDILHNVGNVLNSVGVASGCLAQDLRRSHATRLSQVVSLIAEHRSDLGHFFAEDPKGKLVPEYLAQLAHRLGNEQAAALGEIEQIERNLQHLKTIITLQQAAAKGSCATEKVLPSELVQDTLQLTAGALSRAKTQVATEFVESAPVVLKRHVVLQILVNLVRNAVQACESSDAQPKKIRILADGNDQRLIISVSDNGIGIRPEDLPRIFEHGFTTKASGHGFGLHSCLAAVKDLSGTLTVESPGAGGGAKFTLELPVQPAASPSRVDPASRRES